MAVGRMTGNKTKISVRNLVEFLLREGDIDQRISQMADPEAMRLGSRLHRKLQKKGGASYQAEAPLAMEFPCDDFFVVVEGRADGIFPMTKEHLIREMRPEGGAQEQTGAPDIDTLLPGNITVIDEIKGVFRRLSHIEHPVPVHLAQAKCYAYMTAAEQSLSWIAVRMTYANLETEEVKHFYECYDFPSLECWFLELLEEYKKWARLERRWKRTRQASIHAASFPFPYREGQRDLAASVYRSIARGKLLFVQAPTGTGKTLAMLFPAIKAMGEEKGERIFYLTARTIARTVAQEAFSLLRDQGLRMKTVTLTAKEKICKCETPECIPERCPYAKGHYDRINQALYELILSQDAFPRPVIEEAADRYQVCPFELSLDLTLWADGIIGDYNYVFHPRSKLKRFFGEGVKGDYLYLIDEAHNLVDRGRDMYSAVLTKNHFSDLRRTLIRAADESGNGIKKGAGKQRRKTRKKVPDGQIELFLTQDRESDDNASAMSAERPEYAEEYKHLLSGLKRCERRLGDLQKECPEHRVLEGIGTLPVTLLSLTAAMEEFLERCTDFTLSREVWDLYFEVSTFLEVCDRLDECYVVYDENAAGGFFLRLLCVDPSNNLQECLDKARAAVFFSATLLPVDYYKRLLCTQEAPYAVYASSCFDKSHLKVLIAEDTSSRYTMRGPALYRRIADYILEAVHSHPGNYMVFFPSYRMLEDVRVMLPEALPENKDGDAFDIICQRSGMKEAEREAFLERFQENQSRSLVGLCVMGSIFGEGIDLKADRLIGAIIVGTGLPQVCVEQELLKQFFEKRGMDGFRYAYLCPGMNRVLQAAGRVIRTEEDRGMLLLLDERFLRREYVELFPREWENIRSCSLEGAKTELAQFWQAQKELCKSE